MSKKPSANSKKSRAIDRPFDPAVLAKAGRLAGEYTIFISKHEDGGYQAHWLEYPGVAAFEDTVPAAYKQASEMLVTVIAADLEAGRTLPTPAGEERRTEQVNIRLSAFEKMKLESQAKQQGFRSISDYIRTAALNRSA